MSTIGLDVKIAGKYALNLRYEPTLIFTGGKKDYNKFNLHSSFQIGMVRRVE